MNSPIQFAFLGVALAFFSQSTTQSMSIGYLVVNLAALAVAAEQIFRLIDRLLGRDKPDMTKFVSKEDFVAFQAQLLESTNRIHSRIDALTSHK